MPKKVRFKIVKPVTGSSPLPELSIEVATNPNSRTNAELQQPPIAHSCPSSSTVPTNTQSSNSASSEPSNGEGLSAVTRHVGRKSSHYWWVDAIDEYEDTTKLEMTIKEVNNMDENLRIVVEFDNFGSPIGEAAVLLAGVCGLMSTDCLLFPISFESWKKMPNNFFERQWENFFKTHFFFKTNDDIVKKYLAKSISKKWKEHRLKLWNRSYDPRLSKNDIINNVPEGITNEQWALFVDYRFKPSTKELCKRNQMIRSKQIIPHTTGAKSLARRRDELKKETGKEVGRGEMWKLTHKKKNGSYINEEAREIAEKIDEHMSQNMKNSSEISPTDAVGAIFGKEHPGRVRGLGMGVVPTVAFKRTRFDGMSSSSNSASTSSQEMQNKLAAVESQVQALCAYIAMKEGGQIPAELQALFPTLSTQAPDIGSGPPSPNEVRRSSGGTNNNL